MFLRDRLLPQADFAGGIQKTQQNDVFLELDCSSGQVVACTRTPHGRQMHDLLKLTCYPRLPAEAMSQDGILPQEGG